MKKSRSAARTARHIAGTAACLATFVLGSNASAQSETQPLSGDAQAPAKEDYSNKVGCWARDENGNSVFEPILETRDATAIVGLHPCWVADTSNEKYRLMNDLYAQWTLERVEAGENPDRPRLYEKESRPAFVRLFIGKNQSLVSSVKITMHDPDINFTIPLAAFGYEGRVGKGESWVTDVVSDDQSQPFFRIGPSTSATIAVSAKSSREVEVRATAAVLGALRSITSIVSPGGSLVTKLNAEALNQSAAVADNALSGVWSETIDEKQISSRQLSEWYENASFLVQLNIPKFVKTKDGNSDGTTTRWYRLRLSCPRYSIFDPKPACANGRNPTIDKSTDANNSGSGDPYWAGLGYIGEDFLKAVKPLNVRVSAQQVLNYPLSQGKTLQDHLASQPYYTRFLRLGDSAEEQTSDPAGPVGNNNGLGGVANAPAPAAGAEKSSRTRTRDDYSAFCRSTVDTLYDARLSSFDARLGLWAVVTGSLDLVSLNDKFQDNSDCRYLLPGERWGPWQFEREDISPNVVTKTPQPKRPKKRR